MQAFHVHYHNTQGTLMRILTSVSRRGIELSYVQTTAIETGYRVTMLLEVTPKQVGQLSRDWHAIVDVVDVRAAMPSQEMLQQAGAWTLPHPSATVSAIDPARAAMA